MNDSGFNPTDIFFHVRIVTGFGVGLCLSRLLVFVAEFIQHPIKNHISKVHFLWLILILSSVIFYWWEYLDFNLANENYKLYYIRSIFDVFCLYFICVLLTPSNMDEYGNFSNYLSSRKLFILSVFFAYELFGWITDQYLWVSSGGISYYYYGLVLILLYIMLIFSAVFFKSDKIQITLLLFLIFIHIGLFLL